MRRVGILAVQGAVAAHRARLEALGAEVVEVRAPDHLDAVDAVVLPGGESTTMAKLVASSGLEEPLSRRLASGMAALGTCAGMILLARSVLDGRDDQVSLGAIDLVVRRNAYGRQVDSFEADVDLGLAGGPVHGVFIRAPQVVEVGTGVEVLGRVDGSPVACRQGSVLVTSFHPELAERTSGGAPVPDLRLHERFLDGVA